MINDKQVVGLICECNPFHRGHKKIINEAKKHGDILIAVMSGNYVQRGEPAIIDKYERAKSLLKNGADIVIELPIEYVMSSAKCFAKAGVKILDSLGFVDYLIFGSKINDIDKLNEYSDTTRKFNKKSFKDLKVNPIKCSNYNYPKAIASIIGVDLSGNDILAIEYINALKDIKSKIIPLCIKRDDKLPSASSLREKMKKKIDCDSFSNILNYFIIKEQIHNNGYLNKNSLTIKNIYCMTDDLYNAIMNTNDKRMSFTERAMLLNTKNRTLANIKRLFFNIIFNITKDFACTSKAKFKKSIANTPLIHILGINSKGLSLLHNFKIPYLLSYTPSSYKNLLKFFPKNKSIKLNKKGEFILSDSIKTNIFADDLYYSLINVDISKHRKLFLKYTK